MDQALKELRISCNKKCLNAILSSPVRTLSWELFHSTIKNVDIKVYNTNTTEYAVNYINSLFTYDYVAMKNSTSLFHEELIQKVLHPRRLIKYLEEYDYDAMKKATSLFHEELIQKVLHPRRLMKYLEQYNYDIASEEYYSAF